MARNVRIDRDRTSLRILAVFVSLLLFAVTGCGLLAGSGGDTGGSSSNGQVEKSSISVGVLPITDMAPFYYAKEHGYFKQEGITNVETKTIPGGTGGISSLVNGELDFTFGNWVSFFSAQHEGVLDLKLIADGYQAGPDVFQLMTMPGIDSVKDLQGQKVAINTRNSFNELLVLSQLRFHGMDASDIEFVELDFPDMPYALQRGDVAAISPSEPFITKANGLGATTLTDLATGPTEDIPFSGYGANNGFVQENPKTVAAFQRALKRASAELSGDMTKARDQLPKYAKMDGKTADMVTLGTYPLNLDANRLERVKSLMQVFGMLPKDVKLDLRSMIVQQERGG